MNSSRKRKVAGAEQSRILKPLEDYRSQFTAFSGTYSENGGGHAGDYVLLTGNKGRTPAGIFNSISVDQIAAETSWTGNAVSVAAVFHQTRHWLRRFDQHAVVE